MLDCKIFWIFLDFNEKMIILCVLVAISNKFFLISKKLYWMSAMLLNDVYQHIFRLNAFKAYRRCWNKLLKFLHFLQF